MSKFDRYWTLELHTNKVKFRNAFYSVVVKDSNRPLIENIGLGNTIGRDFFGTIRNETFDIVKRKGIFDLNFSGGALFGKMIQIENVLRLELRIVNNLAFNYVRMVLLALPFSILALVVFNSVIAFLFQIKDGFSSAYTIFVGSMLFGLVIYLETKVIHAYLDSLMNRYNGVLAEIELVANSY